MGGWRHGNGEGVAGNMGAHGDMGVEPKRGMELGGWGRGAAGSGVEGHTGDSAGVRGSGQGSCPPARA